MCFRSTFYVPAIIFGKRNICVNSEIIIIEAPRTRNMDKQSQSPGRNLASHRLTVGSSWNWCRLWWWITKILFRGNQSHLMLRGRAKCLVLKSRTKGTDLKHQPLCVCIPPSAWMFQSDHGPKNSAALMQHSLRELLFWSLAHVPFFSGKMQHKAFIKPTKKSGGNSTPPKTLHPLRREIKPRNSLFLWLLFQALGMPRCTPLCVIWNGCYLCCTFVVHTRFFEIGAPIGRWLPSMPLLVPFSRYIPLFWESRSHFFPRRKRGKSGA